MTTRKSLLAGTILGVAALATTPALAQTTARSAAPATPAPAPAATAAQVDALNKQIQALQSQLDGLKSQVDKDIKAVDKRVADAPTVTVANGRPRIQSADKAFDFALTTRVHLDYGWWFPDQGITTDLPDGFNVRRAFLGITGTAFKDWGYNITFDFSGRANSSGRVQNIGISYNGIKNWAFDIGAFQPSFTLMDSISSNDIPFIERSQTTNIAVTHVSGPEARTAVGFRHWGERYRVSAYLTGQQIGQTAGGTNDDQASGIVRASFLAATDKEYDVHFGLNYGYMWEPGSNATPGPTNYSLSDRPETRIGGLGATGLGFSTGNINTDNLAVYGGEFGASFKSFWTMAEYYRNDFEQKGGPDVDFDTWYVAAGYILTGERRPYSVAAGNFGSPRVASPFGVGGGMGLWELAVRYSVADLTDAGVATGGSTTSAAAILNRALQGEQKVWTFGVNWYANAAVRFMANYNMAKIDRPAGATDTEVDALTLRAQFAF